MLSSRWLYMLGNLIYLLFKPFISFDYIPCLYYSVNSHFIHPFIYWPRFLFDDSFALTIWNEICDLLNRKRSTTWNIYLSIFNLLWHKLLLIGFIRVLFFLGKTYKRRSISCRHFFFDRPGFSFFNKRYSKTEVISIVKVC